MKSLILLMTFLITSPLFAQDREGDLQLPVSELSEIQREEERLPPTIEEVEMTRSKEINDDKEGKKKE